MTPQGRNGQYHSGGERENHTEDDMTGKETIEWESMGAKTMGASILGEEFRLDIATAASQLGLDMLFWKYASG